jgi:D-beta-D-heptose 7-phosphate kinase/D-beta-D-heptose 1-phosphate adenosyltransferase
MTTQFPGKRVLVVGDVMLDEFTWGDVRRISPEAPVPIVEVKRHTSTPGGAGNTAMNLASLGAEVLLGGVIGQDREAERLRDTLRGTKIDVVGLIVDKVRVTTTKTRILAHAQQVIRLDREHKNPLPAESEEALLGWAKQAISSVDVCVLSDYAKGVASPRFCREFISLARQKGKPVIVDPKGTDYTKYRGAAVVKPNALEVQQVLKTDISDEAGWLDAGEKLMAILPGTSLLVTRGADGMSLFQPGKQALHIPSVAREVFDVTGAGDTVVSTLALALAAGASLEQAAELANRAAAIVVGKVGTMAVTLSELQALLA